ncbi:TPA: alpha/beta hydrolase [Stenotrophomonas maltophilia]|nr:alpha/beta hydrolase [Stenotrophomonas maltophilia]HDS1027114.1 alpha/beta hydrolase [Stenotrophomonas maltophilia]HDS1031325.1 alpha/beta hydrolase [Stenotrophomonas maltophilia]HDS1035989.1 alpha/beta hydrolase [Stenotrophomonas maltophilia]
MQRVHGWSVLACLALAGCAMSVPPPAGQDTAKQNPAAAAATPGVVLPDTEALRVHDPVGRDYPIWIALPADYAAHPDKRYPVLYVTDALYSFPLVRSVRNLVGQKGVNLEDFILVGLPPQEGLTSKQSRSRDYTPTDPKRDDPADYSDDVSYGGAAHYRDLLAEQVLPMIDARYRTDPARRVFAGHSYGGLFGAYVLATHPDMFSTYILSSPSLWFDHHRVTRLLGEASAPARSTTVVLSAGSFETIKPGPRYFTHNDMVRDNAAFADQLRRASPGMKVENMVVDGEDHFTVYPEMITRALLLVLPGEGPYSSG